MLVEHTYGVYSMAVKCRAHNIHNNDETAIFQPTPANVSFTSCPPASLNSLSVYRQRPVLRSGLIIPFLSTLFPKFLLLLPKCYSASTFKCAKSFKVS